MSQSSPVSSSVPLSPPSFLPWPLSSPPPQPPRLPPMADFPSAPLDAFQVFLFVVSATSVFPSNDFFSSDIFYFSPFPVFPPGRLAQLSGEANKIRTKFSPKRAIDDHLKEILTAFSYLLSLGDEDFSVFSAQVRARPLWRALCHRLAEGWRHQFVMEYCSKLDSEAVSYSEEYQRGGRIGRYLQLLHSLEALVLRLWQSGAIARHQLVLYKEIWELLKFLDITVEAPETQNRTSASDSSPPQRPNIPLNDRRGQQFEGSGGQPRRPGENGGNY